MLIIKIMLFTCSILLGLGCSIGYKLGANREQKTVDIPFVLAFEPLRPRLFLIITTKQILYVILNLSNFC